jgi:hypothetical protein
MYELLVNLLGKNIEGLEYKQLLKSTGAPSCVYDVPISEVDSLRMLEFFKFGFGLSYNMKEAQFRAIGCEYLAEPNVMRTMSPFLDLGPAGITAQDNQRTVQKKLTVLPISSKKLKSYMRVTYKLPPHLVECVFDSKGNVLKGFSVSLINPAS